MSPTSPIRERESTRALGDCRPSTAHNPRAGPVPPAGAQPITSAADADAKGKAVAAETLRRLQRQQSCNCSISPPSERPAPLGSASAA